MRSATTFILLANLLFIKMDSYGQAFFRGGAVFFQFENKEQLKSFAKINEKTSYYFGGGMEVGMMKILGLEIGANYYKINIDDELQNTDFINGSIVGLPLVLKLKPVKQFSAGIGLMPSVFINPSVLEEVYYKKIDLSGLLKVEIFPIDLIGIEATYTAGFASKETVDFIDPNGVSTLLKSNNKFLCLGLKVRF